MTVPLESPKPTKWYQYKWAEELKWALLVAMIPIVIETLSSFRPDEIVDWRVYIFSIISALVRAVGGGLLAWWGRRKLEGIT